MNANIIHGFKNCFDYLDVSILNQNSTVQCCVFNIYDFIFTEIMLR